MGMYTEVLVKARLRENVAQEVYDVIDYMFGTGEKPTTLPDHRFFTKRSWWHIGKASSWYHHPEVVNHIDKTYPDWSIFSRSDLKDYGGEINAFFEWLRTVIDANEGQCIGYSWYEEDALPTLEVM